MQRDLNLEKQIDAYLKGNLSEDEALKLWEVLFKNPDYIQLLKTELAVKPICKDTKAWIYGSKQK